MADALVGTRTKPLSLARKLDHTLTEKSPDAHRQSAERGLGLARHIDHGADRRGHCHGSALHQSLRYRFTVERFQSGDFTHTDCEQLNTFRAQLAPCRLDDEAGLQSAPLPLVEPDNPDRSTAPG